MSSASPTSDVARGSPPWPTRLIVLSGIALALLCDIFVAYVVYSNYVETRRGAENLNLDLVRVIDEYTLRSMQGVNLLLRTVADDLKDNPALMVQGSPALIADLKQRAAPYPAAEGLAVLDAAGNLLGDNLGNGVPGRRFNFAGRPYFKVQRDGPNAGLFIDVPRAARADSGKSFMAISRALRGPDGRFEGVEFVALDVGAMERFFRSLNIGEHGTINLWRDDGTLLISEPGSQERVGKNLGAQEQVFTRYLKEKPEGTFTTSGNSDGTVRQISYSRVAGFPLIVSAGRAEVEVLAGWKANAWLYSGIAIALNLLIAGFGIVLARQWRLRERSQEALRENVARHRLVTDNVPALILHTDSDYRLRFVNRVAEQWYARPSSELIGRRITDFFPPEHFNHLRSTIEATLAGQPTRIEQKGLYPDGRERWLDYIRVPEIDADGKVGGYFGLAIDITARKEAEEAARKTEEQLRQAQKMEAVGQLTGGVAHDFNNLLGVVIGNLDLLLDALPGDSSAAKGLTEKAIAAAERGADLTRRLLAFARKQTLHPRVTDVNALVGGMAAILRRTLGESIEVKLQQHDELWKCLIDSSQLENAILNLAINARDAMAEGGRLTISTENARLENSIIGEGDSAISGDYVMIAVSDTGCGMSPDTVRRAFEPFFTTKEVGKGTGLGLSMVYGFARQSGGLARIYSELGHGTTVKLYLPRAGSDGDETDHTEKARELRRGTGETILVVEDSPSLAQVASNILVSLGYAPVVAGDGPAALAELEGRSDIALLLTDIILPKGMTGFDIARAARRRLPDLPVIFVSGFTDQSVVPEDFGTDATLLSKPFRVSQLAETVTAALQRVNAP